MTPATLVRIERKKIGITLDHRAHLLLRESKRAVNLFKKTPHRLQPGHKRLRRNPPSTFITSPVEKLTFTEAIALPASATSSEKPHRFIGVKPSSIIRSYFSLTVDVMSVAITPGRIS